MRNITAALAFILFFPAPDLPAESADDPLQVASGTPAVLIAGVKPVYPPMALRTGIEGWVVVTFTVQPDGSTNDIRITETSIDGHFEQAAIDSIKTRTYIPATFNGEPVAQANTQTRVTFSIESPDEDDESRGVSRMFFSRYEKAMAALDEGNLEEALEHMQIIEERKQRKLVEVCYLDTLASLYWEQKGDMSNAAYYLERALVVSDMVLPESKQIALLKKAITLDLTIGDYPDVFRHYQELTELEELPADDPIESLVRKLREFVNNDKAFAVPGKIEPPCSTCEPGFAFWRHELLRKQFTINVNGGFISELHLLCDYNYVTFAFQPGRSWAVNPSWGQCAVRVHGEVGTMFQLVELPGSTTIAAGGE